MISYSIANTAESSIEQMAAGLSATRQRYGLEPLIETGIFSELLVIEYDLSEIGPGL